MKKRVAIITLIVVGCMLCGCVSQKDYDAVVAERDSLNQQVENLRGEISGLEEENQNLSNQIDEISDERDQAVKDYEELETELKNAKEVLEEYVRVNTEDNFNEDVNRDGDDAPDEDLFDEGKEFGDNLSEDLANLDWEKAKEDAQKAGEELADFFNDLLN